MPSTKSVVARRYVPSPNPTARLRQRSAGIAAFQQLLELAAEDRSLTSIAPESASAPRHARIQGLDDASICELVAASARLHRSRVAVKSRTRLFFD
jgi:hypothetical protein